MAYRNYVKIILKLIAVITIVSGLVQVVSPDFVLEIIGGEVNASTRHFFGIVGMFMMFFGGLLYHALVSNQPQRAAVLWCGVQKFGAAGAVALGVTRGIFSCLALGVAAFDFVSAIIIMTYWFSIHER
jgi:hypothetical protein